MKPLITTLSILLLTTSAYAQSARVKDASRYLSKQSSIPESESRKYEKYYGVTYTVDRVIDGDTIKLTNGEIVELIGIDAPESESNDKAKRDAERTGQDFETITKMGQEATEFVRKLLYEYTNNVEATLEFDVQERDKYDRLLAYVYILACPNNQIGCLYDKYPDIEYMLTDDNVLYINLNATIIKSGYAQPMTIPPNVKYADLFQELYEEARENKRGLWKEEIKEEEMVMCTMDAKECPDGSYVGRVGPNCEFKACPE